ncbi:hemerythrin domain-containing protein, partial [Acidobacteria bacterium AH-259-L09]|nr:hemerythrin domain-containing protein [Acidobacteria bacterium AH-259-L09]
MKRHESLIPLSHDHHLGLILAQRIKQGKSKAPQSSWPERRDLQRDRAVEFFDTELIFHLQAEEKFLFPLAEKYLPPENEIISLLRKHHAQLRNLIMQLRAAEGLQLENMLLRFAHVLEEHIRKEERIFFQQIQKEIPEDQL